MSQLTFVLPMIYYNYQMIRLIRSYIQIGTRNRFYPKYYYKIGKRIRKLYGTNSPSVFLLYVIEIIINIINWGIIIAFMFIGIMLKTDILYLSMFILFAIMAEDLFVILFQAIIMRMIK